MKITAILILAGTILLSGSCHKNRHDYRNLLVQLHLVKTDGTDLLAPGSENYIKKQDITIYHMLGGQKVRMYNANLASPGYFTIHENDTIFGSEPKYFMSVLLSSETDANNVSTTIIEYKNRPADTLKSTIHRSANDVAVFYTALEINGEVADIEAPIFLVKE